MIIPSIDILEGQAVQLVGGREKALDIGDPRPWARRLGRIGEVAVVDLDAALGRGSNAALIRELLPLARCRVGGGIRDVDTALSWLDAGAAKVVLGTRAVPEVLRALPRERVIAALDAFEGEVVIEGWRTRTGESILDRMEAIGDLVGGFLVTFVEREGRLQGTSLERVETLVRGAGAARLTVAGGVTAADEVAALDRLGADAQVGMALYTGRLPLVDAFAAPLRAGESGLWPTVVVDDLGVALGLAWSSRESLARALDEGRGIYHSRRRGLWAKGETSGATQDLLRIDTDCDRDALRFTVRQHGSGFCHGGTWTCWGAAGGLGDLARRLLKRCEHAPPGSFTARLLENPGLLRAKLLEEAVELADAASPQEVIWEAADVLYFTLVALARSRGALADVAAELDRRSLRVRRRESTHPPGPRAEEATP